MRKSLTGLWLVCLLLSASAWAQDQVVTGKITSSNDGSPLPGVSVQVKGTNRGTSSDADGNYRINVTANARLIFSFIGAISQEVAVGNQTTINIQLQDDATNLNEAVVIGYGVSLTKKEATGATSNLKSKDIENLPLQSFDRAMQGRAAGVQIQSNSGTPGGAVQVRIRGTGSISAGNEPLYVVDGIQMNSQNSGNGRVSTNPLAFLNPNDIESIDVLKDAATAAIYGAQAANGVVLITTKKGKAGAKTRVNFNYYQGIVEPVKNLDVLNTQEFIKVRTEALRTSRPTTDPTVIRATVLESLGFSRDLTDSQINVLPTYSWQDETYKTGHVSNYELSAQGGNDRTTFYVSGSINQNDASLINIDFKRYAGRLSLTHKLNNKLTFETGINLSSILQRAPFGGADGSTTFGAPQYGSPLILPFNPIYNPDGTYYGMPGASTSIIGDITSNGIANSNYDKITGRTNQLVSNVGLTYSITKDLIFKAFGGIDYRNLHTTFFGDPRTSDYYSIKGSLGETTNNNTNLTTNYTLNYAKSFAQKHTVTALAGFEYRQEANESVNLSAVGFPSPELNTANAAAEPSSVGGAWTGFKRAGVFGRVSYDYDKRYLLNGTLRYDGSSRFGADNQWGVFPSIAAKWNIIEEAFLKSNQTISDLGLRFSIGSTGNDQISDFAARRLYGLGGVYQGSSGIGPSQLGNPKLKWERNVTYNLGLDYGFFNGRIKGAIEAYKRLSKDLLLTRSIPSTNGFSSILENVGEVENKGLEFELNTINVDYGGFRWETNFNISFQDNKVVRLFEGVDVLPGNLGIRVGYPLGTNVGIPYLGVNPANGRPVWLDINNNITYLTKTADQRPLGHANLTKQFGGLTNTLSFKGVEVSAFFQYDLGRTAYNVQEFRLADNGGVLRNSLAYYYDNRWTTPGQITDVPRPAENRTELSSRISSYQSAARFYQDASYVRLKQLTVSYSLPKSLIQRIKLDHVRLYAQGINVLTWTKWTGFDPEFADPANTNGNQGIVPQSRSYTFGVQIGL